MSDTGWRPDAGEGAQTVFAREPVYVRVAPGSSSATAHLALDLQVVGEEVVAADVQPGHTHRGVEKIAENIGYEGFFAVLARMNPDNPHAAPLVYAAALEKLLAIADGIPPRARVLRAILLEMSRVKAHLSAIQRLMDALGARSLAGRIQVLRHRWAKVFAGWPAGHDIVSIGGLRRDVDVPWVQSVRASLDDFSSWVDEVWGLVDANTTVARRLDRLGMINRDLVVSYALSGPVAKAAGESFDERAQDPMYLEAGYRPIVGAAGDAHERNAVRFSEVKNSVILIAGLLNALPPGLCQMTDGPGVMPDKTRARQTLAACVTRTRLLTEGVCVPAGTGHAIIQSAEGALALFLVSDGGRAPFRLRLRPPSFANMAVLGAVLPGTTLEDVAPLVASFAIEAGACDR